MHRKLRLQHASLESRMPKSQIARTQPIHSSLLSDIPDSVAVTVAADENWGQCYRECWGVMPTSPAASPQQDDWFSFEEEAMRLLGSRRQHNAVAADLLWISRTFSKY